MWTVVVVTLLTVVTLIELRTVAVSFFYPPPPRMPSVVDKSMGQVLADLEDKLNQKAPAVLASLQPGLSDAEIAKLEQRGGFKLSDDMKALYKWHNGARSGGTSQKPGTVSSTMGPIPGCVFIPLDEAIKQREQMWQPQYGNPTQRVVLYFFASHRKSWITVFDDGAGDGYFYDPKKKDSEGALFYSFAETRTYTFFPSVKNLIAWTTKCYELDVFKTHNESGAINVDEDSKRAMDLQGEFASSLS